MSNDKIIVHIHDEPKIIVHFGEQGLRGTPGGNTDHALLSNLDYDNAGHTGFQKKLNYITEYKGYEVD